MVYVKLADRDIPVLEEWTPLPEAAEKLGFSRQYAYKKAAEGFFPSIRKVGKKYSTYVVKTSEVEHLVEQREQRVGVREQELEIDG